MKLDPVSLWGEKRRILLASGNKKLFCLHYSHEQPSSSLSSPLHRPLTNPPIKVGLMVKSGGPFGTTCSVLYCAYSPRPLPFLLSVSNSVHSKAIIIVKHK